MTRLDSGGQRSRSQQDARYKVMYIMYAFYTVITGPPTHNVGARLVTVAGVCRRRL